jgi:hypothetical protein
MATLTASGINCSNGTLDGQYTGSAANNTSYPIGSILVRQYDACVGLTFKLNAATSPNYVSISLPYVTAAFAAGYVTLSGTWVSRGGPSGSTHLIQRTA